MKSESSNSRDISSDQVNSPTRDKLPILEELTTSSDSATPATAATPEENEEPVDCLAGVAQKCHRSYCAVGRGYQQHVCAENLRVSQDFVEQANVEQIIGMISVRKPGKQEFFRVRPGDDWQLLVAVIEDGEDRELWVIHRSLAQEVADEINVVLLRLAVNRNAVPFLWPLKISADGKSNPWNRSAMVAAENATKRWVRMYSDRAAGHYKTVAAKNDFAEPEWPDMTFEKILELAFKNRIITDCNHPFLKQLRGEA